MDACPASSPKWLGQPCYRGAVCHPSPAPYTAWSSSGSEPRCTRRPPPSPGRVPRGLAVACNSRGLIATSSWALDPSSTPARGTLTPRRDLTVPLVLPVSILIKVHPHDRLPAEHALGHKHVIIRGETLHRPTTFVHAAVHPPPWSKSPSQHTPGTSVHRGCSRGDSAGSAAQVKDQIAHGHRHDHHLPPLHPAPSPMDCHPLPPHRRPTAPHLLPCGTDAVRDLTGGATVPPAEWPLRDRHGRAQHHHRDRSLRPV